MSDKQIAEWQEKVRQSFGDESKLYQYLFETMDNFYYRYLETTTHKDLKTIQLGPHFWGAESIEGSMVDALKIQNRAAKDGIIALAKAVPKSEGPEVHYSLTADVKELTPDHGTIILKSTIDWGFPDFKQADKTCSKSITFKYEDLAQFRKELAQKLEEVCEIFL